MQNTILMAKILDRNAKNKSFAINIPNVEITQVYSITNVWLKYYWYLNPTDNKATIDREPQSVKKDE